MSYVVVSWLMYLKCTETHKMRIKVLPLTPKESSFYPFYSPPLTLVVFNHPISLTTLLTGDLAASNSNSCFLQLWSQRPLHVQEDASHPGWQGGGQVKNKRKKWRAEEEERHKGSLHQKNHLATLEIISRSMGAQWIMIKCVCALWSGVREKRNACGKHLCVTSTDCQPCNWRAATPIVHFYSITNRLVRF
jgi:hypothetical protein